MPNICFIHGRPGPHPSHATLAESVGAQFVFVDRIMRYHDLENSGRIRRYSSWLLNSILLPGARGFDLIISEGLHITPVLMKQLGVIGKRQKIAAMLGSETLYFLKAKYYQPQTVSFLTRILASFDALICLSEMQSEFAQELMVGFKKSPRIFTAHELVSKERMQKFLRVRPNLKQKKILFVANGPSGWRIFYKGLENVIETFELIAERYSDATLTIVGKWDLEVVKNVQSRMRFGGDRLFFAGVQSDLTPFFEEASLCLHLSNGDAFPVSTLEAMSAGVPTIVSTTTGTKEVVKVIEPRLVVDSEPMAAIKAVDWYFGLSEGAKVGISDRSRELASRYNDTESVAEFKKAVDSILNIR